MRFASLLLLLARCMLQWPLILRTIDYSPSGILTNNVLTDIHLPGDVWAVRHCS
jgi:hypothetical protein